MSEKATLHGKKNTKDLVKSLLFLAVSKSQFSQLSPRLCETNSWILFKVLFVPLWLGLIRSGSFLKSFLTRVFGCFFVLRNLTNFHLESRAYFMWKGSNPCLLLTSASC